MLIRYHLFFYCLSILLTVVGVLYHPVFFILLIGYYSFVYKRLGLKNLLMIVAVTFVFYNTMNYPSVSKDTTINGKIVTKEEDNIVLKTSNTKVKVYGEFKEYKEGDELALEVLYFDINEPTNDNAFNYKNYLYSLGITSQAKCIKIISYRHHNTFYQKLKQRISGNDQISSYASLFILGVKDNQMKDIYNQLTELSIVHLFALSGLHIQILIKMLKNIFKYFINKKIVEYLVLTLIGVYLYNIPYNISFSRAYFVLAIYTIFKKHINQLDALSIVCVMMIFLNPYIIYNLSFIFSYSIYFIVLCLKEHKYANYLVYVATIPIVLSIQFRINLISMFLGVILIPIISFLYQLIVCYVIVGNIIAPIINIVLTIFNNIILLSNRLSLFINFSKPTLFFVLAYYFFFFYAIVKFNQGRSYKREMVLLFSLLFMFYFKPYFSIEGKVVMIDVGQGDCFLIKQPFNRGNILIDAGGLKNKDVANNVIIPYLRSEGVFKLDYVFISHNDYDHNGSYEELAKNIKVVNKIEKYTPKIEIGDVEIKMYQTEMENSDINDQSLVFIARVNNLNYLFSGDISEKVEEAMYLKYQYLDVDVLKVAHHGSKSSTGNYLFKMISPKVALISCGKNNLYGHPHQEVLKRLQSNGVVIYRSDYNGMVSIRYYGDNNYIYP